MKHDTTERVICPYETTFLQFVGDNTDHDLATVDGKNTHHGLGSIAIPKGKFSNSKFIRQAISRDKKQNWSDIASNKGIEIKQYNSLDVPALGRTVMRPVIQSILHDCSIDILWNFARVFNKSCLNWSGYMRSLKTNDHPLTKSVITMLPVINLHATDTTALYSLLSFVTDQSSKLNVPTPSITFDQPLYVKDYNIVSSMNMNILFRLGGFHQVISFLGSIGCLMEGSGLRAALENVYAPVTFGHMFSGKAFARAIRGHMLCASAVLSLLLEEFRDSISSEEKSQLAKILDTFNPTLTEPGDKVKNLVSWLENKKFELSSKSRTSTLWLNFT